MVSFFRELENPNGYYIDFNDISSCNKKEVNLEILPITFFEKYSYLFKKIEEYDLLFEKNNNGKKLYLNSNFNYPDVPLEWLYGSFIDGRSLNSLDGMNLSKNGIEKMYFLKEEYSDRYNGNDFVSDFLEYFMAIYDYFIYFEKLIDCSKEAIFRYLTATKTMAKYQDKLTKNDEVLFDEALTYIRNYKIEISNNDHKTFRMYLPNSWYITPYNHLYNSMGVNGHKEASLIYPFYYSIVRDDNVYNFSSYLKEAKMTLKNGFVDKTTFEHYTNLHFDFSSFYPEYYFYLNDIDKSKYRCTDHKTYNPKIVMLIAGIQSAHAGLYSFFNSLKNNSCDYYGDLDFVKKLGLDEILVRCCGFHKISSILDKTITTSCVYYEEELSEYIKRGWNIDFVKPIVLNPSTKRLEEYSDEFLLIKKMLCKRK